MTNKSVRFLADTHALIWWWDENPQLSAAARDAMSERQNLVFISAASAWEIATKVRAGKLPSMARRIADYHASVIGDGFRHLDVTHEHGVRGGMLDGDHRDPFDRLLAAQALQEDLIVLTRDPRFSAFGCRTLW